MAAHSDCYPFNKIFHAERQEFEHEHQWILFYIFLYTIIQAIHVEQLSDRAHPIITLHLMWNSNAKSMLKNEIVICTLLTIQTKCCNKCDLIFQ